MSGVRWAAYQRKGRRLSRTAWRLSVNVGRHQTLRTFHRTKRAARRREAELRAKEWGAPP